jgi:hypothetical protein
MNNLGQPADPPKPLFVGVPTTAFDPRRTSSAAGLSETHNTQWVEGTSNVGGAVANLKTGPMISLPLWRDLPYRYIYFYLQALRPTDGSGGSFFIEGQITLLREEKPVLTLPAHLGFNILAAQGGAARADLFATVGGEDLIYLILDDRNNSRASGLGPEFGATVSGHRFVCSADRIQFDLLRYAGGGMYGHYAYLGVKSFSHPW